VKILPLIFFEGEDSMNECLNNLKDIQEKIIHLNELINEMTVLQGKYINCLCLRIDTVIKIVEKLGKGSLN
jgi:hypothetical protein